MKKVTEAYGGGVAWRLFDFIAEVLVLPVGILMAPIPSVGRAVGHARARGHLADLSREVALSCQKQKMMGKAANKFLRGRLEALENLEKHFSSTNQGGSR